MRWILLILILMFAVFALVRDPAPVPAEESVVGEPIRALNAAEGVEDAYLQAEEERKKRMEAALDEAGGGD